MIFSVIGFMDLLGTIAFAISGALVGVKRDMDIFGINILAVITACGGGMTRDVVIGKEPPVMFVNPIYVLIAVITANIVFLYLYTNRRLPGSKKTLNALFFWCDTLGLAAFTVDGVFAGINIGMDRLFLCTFLGTDGGRRRRDPRYLCESDAGDFSEEHLRDGLCSGRHLNGSGLETFRFRKHGGPDRQRLCDTGALCGGALQLEFAACAETGSTALIKKDPRGGLF